MSDYICGIVDDIWPRDTKAGEYWSIQINGQDFGYGKFPPKFGIGSEVEFDIQWNGDYANVNWDSVNIIDNQGEVFKASGANKSSGGGQRNGSGGNGGQRNSGSQGRSGSGQRSGGGNAQRGQGNQGSGRSGSSSSSSQRSSGGGDAPRGGGAQRSASAPVSKDDYWKLKDEKDEAKQATIQYQASRNAAIHLVDVLVKNELVKLPPVSKMADRYDATLALVETLTAKFQEETAILGGDSKPPAGKGSGRKSTQQQEEQQDEDDDGLPEYEGDDE